MRYRVKDPLHFGTHQGDIKRYQPGDIVEMSEQTAAPLLDLATIEPYRPAAVEMVLNPQFSK